MDTNPKVLPYGEPKYWDWRYEREHDAKGLEHTYDDWYMGFEELYGLSSRRTQAIILATRHESSPKLTHKSFDTSQHP